MTLRSKRLIDDWLRLDEFATKRLWNHLFSKEIFSEKEFVIGPEQPPVQLHSRRRADFIIERYSGRELVIQVMVELKKGRAGPQDVVDVESQLYSACYEYYTEHPEREKMWTCSICGPRVRIWAFDAQLDYLVPACPAYGAIGEISSYLDFRTSEATLMAYSDTIKQNLQPPDAVFEVSEASTSDESMSDDVILEELNPVSVTFAVAVKRRSQGPKIKTRDGTGVSTDKARWKPAQCMVDGTMVKGFKYVGNSGTVYLSMNANNYF
ncbi:hypothetical protein CTAM01_16961 [Colletotrichum tamarilloi]|uniref:Uncharacterized protein n=2 Tax=Colletotrichum acutatum species complex TaxID=2707335 RepID=A0ABQ9PAB8_9PEZI|nr:uncharacterized protein CTAM01_16961 [Colletotrichum tamarilloi]KAK0368479.1 hypothetical protein CLIM01_14166 [Colletotrichum limetticola]KAK1468083.1 hypothetical protein CTAM01_16961 [Colletotrichum tamarilloi]